MRVSPTPEQLKYLASIGVSMEIQVESEAQHNAGGGPKEEGTCLQSNRLRARALLGFVAGLCSGPIGLLLGGIFGMVTHGLFWGACLSIGTAIGWLLIGFLWSFGWKSDEELSDEFKFSDAEIGIEIATALGTIGFGTCFCGMFVALVIAGLPGAKVWIKSALFLIWVIGVLPGLVVSLVRLFEASNCEDRG